ncbi:MAG: hypothetical protein IPI10_16055 [Bacteroidetes bacterium]|nr:hypothetical protein [Bacteroidota bacterium]MBK7429987.1 hypothetical protein [Bacteroidota bacterium]MBK7573048.1 hypothetical protein [Bacteroidota bacterium]MBP9791450.1 hypothetical protein [Bacteroidia bacterium]
MKIVFVAIAASLLSFNAYSQTDSTNNQRNSDFHQNSDRDQSKMRIDSGAHIQNQGTDEVKPNNSGTNGSRTNDPRSNDSGTNGSGTNNSQGDDMQRNNSQKSDSMNSSKTKINAKLKI